MIHLQHPTRAVPRELRPGDRVRDKGVGGFPSSPNYPGASKYGTVTRVPEHRYETDFANVRHLLHPDKWVDVSYDDGYNGSAPVTDLERL